MASNEVFLSYASADRERVTTLVHALEAEGMQVWWDRDIAYGESFHKVIEQALDAAACVIVVWTSNSVASEWVVNEASDARKRNRLVPVMLEPLTPPLEFRHLQTADLSRWVGDASDPEFAGLRHAVSAMLARSDPSKAKAPVPRSRANAVANQTDAVARHRRSGARRVGAAVHAEVCGRDRSLGSGRQVGDTFDADHRQVPTEVKPRSPRSRARRRRRLARRLPNQPTFSTPRAARA